MSSLFDAACAAVLAEIDGAALLTDIARVDVRSRKLTLEVDGAGGKRWFEWAPGALRELDPIRDRALPGSPTWRSQRHSILAYRPGRRLVLCSKQDPRTIVKLVRAGRAEDCARRHDALARTAAFVTAPLASWDDAQGTLLFARLDGAPLTLGDPGGESTSTERLRLIGCSLRRMQDSEEDLALAPFSLRDELGVLRTWRERVERALGGLPADWDDAALAAEREATRLPDEEIGPVHRDLHDKQFLWTAGGPALLDFDLAALGDTALDPGNLCAHLTLRELQGLCDGSAAEAGREALLSGLGRLDAAFTARVSFFEATTFLRLALVYSLRPRWRALAPQLVERAARSLIEVAA